MLSRLLLAFAGLCAAKKDCSDVAQTIGPCAVSIHECVGIYKFEVKFSAVASASSKATPTDGDNYDSKSGAADHALYDLFLNRLDSTFDNDDCSCGHQDTKVGSCTFRVSSCIMFDSPDKVESGTVSYKSTAWDTGDHTCTGAVTSYPDAASAGAAAVTAAMGKCPAVAAKCGKISEREVQANLVEAH
jgi:hypothetical protein